MPGPPTHKIYWSISSLRWSLSEVPYTQANNILQFLPSCTSFSWLETGSWQRDHNGERWVPMLIQYVLLSGHLDAGLNRRKESKRDTDGHLGLVVGVGAGQRQGHTLWYSGVTPVLTNYSLLCSKDHLGCWGLNPGQPHAKKTPSPLSYLCPEIWGWKQRPEWSHRKPRDTRNYQQLKEAERSWEVRRSRVLPTPCWQNGDNTILLLKPPSL